MKYQPINIYFYRLIEEQKSKPVLEFPSENKLTGLSGSFLKLLEVIYFMVHSHNGFFWIKHILSEQETDHFSFFLIMKWMTMPIRRKLWNRKGN